MMLATMMIGGSGNVVCRAQEWRSAATKRISKGRSVEDAVS